MIRRPPRSTLFPTRRSSDLTDLSVLQRFDSGDLSRRRAIEKGSETPEMKRRPCPSQWHVRSEEHTSELQSRLHLVCRLLLEKKKNNRNRLKHSYVYTMCRST